MVELAVLDLIILKILSNYLKDSITLKFCSSKLQESSAPSDTETCEKAVEPPSLKQRRIICPAIPTVHPRQPRHSKTKCQPDMEYLGKGIAAQLH